ncbi:MAG: threonylcarbamoyl-AMP synthase [Candidatus Levybacteria bacterium]|nr:threonylcarbamoyl-AMP synthase [Candidatus Levybacteria bacterium]
MDNQIKQAVKILQEGGIVIFPTDTAFGIGSKISDTHAIQRLFAMRKRPESKATPVLVDTVKMAQAYLKPISQEVIDMLIEPYWPGALTIVLPCLVEKVPSLVRGNTNTLGVRIPNHPVARRLIRALGEPILGPSANFSGEKTPYEFEDLDKSLLKKVDYVVKGECVIKQPARHASRALRGVAGRASTVIDCTTKPWKVLRKGAIHIQIP